MVTRKDWELNVDRSKSADLANLMEDAKAKTIVHIRAKSRVTGPVEDLNISQEEI